MIVLYFGPWGQAGHHLFRPSGIHSRPSRQAGPWTLAELDATPYTWRGGQLGADSGRGVVPVDQHEREGVWRLTHRDGWTALGAWDRSCDTRRGSKAVFIAEGTHDEQAMREIAAREFPEVWARIERTTGAERSERR